MSIIYSNKGAKNPGFPLSVKLFILQQDLMKANRIFQLNQFVRADANVTYIMKMTGKNFSKEIKQQNGK